MVGGVGTCGQTTTTCQRDVPDLDYLVSGGIGRDGGREGEGREGRGERKGGREGGREWVREWRER